MFQSKKTLIHLFGLMVNDIRPYMLEVFEFLRFWLFLSPIKSLLYWLFTLGSIFVPGMGSQTLATRAKDIYDDMLADYYKVVTLKRRRNLLIQRFNQTATQYSSAEQEVIQTLMQKSSVNLVSVDEFALMRLERVMTLPKRTRLLSGHTDGEKLKKMLTDHAYPVDIARSIYTYIAMAATAMKYNTGVARQAPYLIGPPGTGKTFLVKKIAETLQLPFFYVTHTRTTREAYFRDVFLGTDVDNYLKQAGTLPEFLAKQTDSLGNPMKENIYPIVLFFDELDKMTKSADPTMRPFLLELLNNDVDHNIKSPGLGNLVIPFDKCLIFIGANEPVDRITYSDDHRQHKSVVDDAFMSRVDQLAFPPCTSEQKEKITALITEQVAQSFGRTELPQSTKSKLKELLDADTEPGVRVLKSKIHECIVNEIAAEDGWVF